MSTSERPSAARASLGGSLDAFDGAQDGGTMDGVNPASLGLRFTVDQHGIGGTGGKCGIGNARYLYGAGELGGGHGLPSVKRRICSTVAKSATVPTVFCNDFLLSPFPTIAPSGLKRTRPCEPSVQFALVLIRAGVD